MKQTILMIEDDRTIREGVKILLEGEGYLVEEAENGMRGLKRLTEKTDLVILDVMMPGLSGLQTCAEIRKISSVPVLFLTAKGKESDKLIGLTVGGDDYLVKPFSYAELLGRVKALLRRRNIYDRDYLSEQIIQEEWIERAQIRLNTRNNRVICRGEEISLTDIEYRICLLFLQYPHKVFSVANLYESAWGERYEHDFSNTVMVHIRRLRKKIEIDPQKPTLILTVWGKGYRFGE